MKDNNNYRTGQKEKKIKNIQTKRTLNECKLVPFLEKKIFLKYAAYNDFLQR